MIFMGLLWIWVVFMRFCGFFDNFEGSYEIFENFREFCGFLWVNDFKGPVP